MADQVFDPLPSGAGPPGARAARCSSAGSGRGRSRSSASRTRAGRSGASSTARSPRTDQMLGVHHGLGADAEGRLPALQGSPGLRAALPERLRLSGSLDRGRGRARARPQLEARDRGVRARRVRSALPRGRRAVVARVDRRARSGSGSGWTGATTTSPSATRTSSTSGASCAHVARAGLALPWPPLDGVVPPLRDVDLAHELVGSYVDRADPSLYVRFPLLDRPGEALVVWTTTPWTLPANVAAAVKPDAEYGLRDNGEWVARRPLPGRGRSRSGGAGEELVGLALRGPVRRRCAPRQGSRPPRHPVGRGLARRGHRDRPHRAGRRHRGLRAVARPRPAGADARGRGGPLLRRLRLAARAVDRRGRPTRSSGTSRSAGGWSRPGCTSTATPSAGAATRR